MKGLLGRKVAFGSGLGQPKRRNVLEEVIIVFICICCRSIHFCGLMLPVSD